MIYIQSSREFCAGPFSEVRISKFLHGLDGLIGHHCFFGTSEGRETGGNEGSVRGVAVCCGWAGAVVNDSVQCGRQMVNESETVVEFDRWEVRERIWDPRRGGCRRATTETSSQRVMIIRERKK